MKNASHLVIAAVSGLNLISLIFWAGLKPQLKDSPLVMAKEATAANFDGSLYNVAAAYHDAQFREQKLLMAGILSCILSVATLTISVKAIAQTRNV